MSPQRLNPRPPSISLATNLLKHWNDFQIELFKFGATVQKFCSNRTPNLTTKLSPVLLKHLNSLQQLFGKDFAINWNIQKWRNEEEHTDKAWKQNSVELELSGICRHVFIQIYVIIRSKTMVCDVCVYTERGCANYCLGEKLFPIYINSLFLTQISSSCTWINWEQWRRNNN